MTERRTFLKLLGAAGAAVGLARYAEPFMPVPDKLVGLRDWIEDRGDFYIVRVPDFKSFANAHLEKPTIFLLGERATVSKVQVDAFVNVQAPRGGTVEGSIFDARKVTVGRDRPVVEFTNTSGMHMTNCCVHSPGGIMGLRMESTNVHLLRH